MQELQTKNEIIQEICELMDHAAQIEHYWQEINHSTLKKFTSSFPTRWLNFQWTVETPLKADVTRALFDKLAMFLGSIESSTTFDIQDVDDDWQTLRTESYALLDTCAIPSSLERHWLTYTIGSIALAAAYYHLKNKLAGQALFEIENEPSLKNHVARIPTPQGPHTFLDTYRLSTINNTQYIEVAKKDASAVRNFLQERQYTHVVERTPTLHDLKKNMYNEEGNTHINVWFQEHCIKPCEDLYTVLFSDRHRPTILASDVKHFEQKWEIALDNLIKNAATCPETQACVTQISGTTPLDQLSFNQKRKIHTELLFYFNENFHSDIMRFLNEAYNQAQVEPELHGTLNKFFTKTLNTLSTKTLSYTVDPDLKIYVTASKWIPTIGALLEKLRQEQTAPNSLLGLSLSTVIVEASGKDLQINNLFNIIGNLVDAQRLTFATMATMPIALAGYAVYKGTQAITQRITKRTFIEPLKQDLLSLQITLNSHRYQNTLDEHTNGLCKYFTTRLNKYLKKLSANERPRYALYIEQLANSALTPEQRMQTIECMFKEFNFLK